MVTRSRKSKNRGSKKSKGSKRSVHASRNASQSKRTLSKKSKSIIGGATQKGRGIDVIDALGGRSLVEIFLWDSCPHCHSYRSIVDDLIVRSNLDTMFNVVTLYGDYPIVPGLEITQFPATLVTTNGNSGFYTGARDYDSVLNGLIEFGIKNKIADQIVENLGF